MPSACQSMSDTLCGGFVGEGAYQDPIIRTFGTLAWGRVRLGKPVLHLRQHGLGVGLVFKGSHLDLIDERLLGTLFSLGRFFRDDHPYRADALFYEAKTVRGGFGKINDAALGVGPRSVILTSTCSPVARFSTMTLVPKGSWRWAAVISF